MILHEFTVWWDRIGNENFRCGAGGGVRQREDRKAVVSSQGHDSLQTIVEPFLESSTLDISEGYHFFCKISTISVWFLGFNVNCKFRGEPPTRLSLDVQVNDDDG